MVRTGKVRQLIYIAAFLLLCVPVVHAAYSWWYTATALTGGGTGSLDSIDGTDLTDSDKAIYSNGSGSICFYDLDYTSGASESSPTIISPDTNAGDKRWSLVWCNNTDTSISTLANEATPSVLSGSKFITGGTTTITDFDDGYTGQIIHIISEHSITITDGTNIFLNGSANFDMQDRDTLSLVCKADNKWYELSRSDTSFSTASFYPAAGGDDGFVISTGSFWDNNGGVIYIGAAPGTTYNSWHRFTNVTVAQGATIQSAYLKLYPSGQFPGLVTKFKIYAEDSDDATAPTTYNEYTNLTLTTANVDWDPTSGTAGVQMTSSDIKTVIQEIVDRGSWASGNAIQIVVKDDGTVVLGEGGDRLDVRDWEYYNSNAIYRPELEISWVE